MPPKRTRDVTPTRNESNSCILSINRPAIEENRTTGLRFLESCHYCKKRIDPKSAAFMYRDFCAYCSVECRSHQMEIDEKAITNQCHAPKRKVRFSSID